MPRTDGDSFEESFKWQLRVALDRVQPSLPAPRYRTGQPLRTMRLAPKLLMVAVTGVLVLTIFAATGSYTPKAIEQQIVTAIQSYQEPSPTPQESTSAPAPRAAPVPPVTRPVPGKPAETPKSDQSGKNKEPSESPRPSDSPASDSDHNDSRPGSGPPQPGEQH